MTAVPSTPRSPTPGKVATFLDLIKFGHSIFALPFALIATFWASRAIHEAWPGVGRVGLILACMVIARTFAMTFNRLVDRKFDALNPRTARRPSVTGAVSITFMAGTCGLCIFLFLAATAGFYFAYANPWPVILGLPVVMWLGGYSLMKRVSALCHFWLGASLGLAPISAWIAIAPPQVSPTDPRVLTIILLGVGVMFWVAGFDILYALQDEDFDREQQLRSIPAAIGRRRALLVSRVCHVLTLAAFVGVGITGQFHVLYAVGLACAGVLLVVEQSLVSPKDISKINIAFMTANGLIGILFGALAIADTLLL